jgi:ABC-2 type transport system ATP-binding protein
MDPSAGDAEMIRTEGLRKSYRAHRVLDGVRLSVPRGSVLALLGPNGAGKTTTVNILTTLVRPDSGTVRIGGVDVLRRPDAARAMIALTGQYAAVDEFQTGRENLAMMCRLAHLGRAGARARADELIDDFGLGDAANRVVSGYSGGMRRRLDLAISLIARPPVLVLDEPTTGLDPRSRAQLWDRVRTLAAEGTTILLTTQYMEEADRLADRIAVLDAGRIVAEGTAEELKSRVSGSRVVLSFDDAASYEGAARLRLADADCAAESMTISVPTSRPVEAIRELLSATGERGLDVSGIEVVRPSLDDVFMALTGHPVRETRGDAEGVAA